LQALAEAAAANVQIPHGTKDSPDGAKIKSGVTLNHAQTAAVALASSSSLQVRRLFCLSHCLLGRLVEWRDVSEASVPYPKYETLNLF
jgi:hypothetical protein